jgi:type I restriction enzyme S subunit
MASEFKQTDIGLIPEDWKLIHLDNEDYFETLNGLWKGKKTPFIKIHVLRNTNFTNSGKLDYSDVAELDVEIKQYEKRKLLCGDIIIERSGGGPTQPVGRVVFFDRTNGEFSFSNFTSVLRIKKPDEIYPEFLFYSLLSFYLGGRTYALQGRTTGIRNLDFNKYKTTVDVPKLPLYEQRKIAYILSMIQQAIEKQEQIIKTTQELKKALMQKLFTEGINNEPQKQTEIGLIPQSWEVKRIDEIADDFVGGGTPSTSKQDYWNGDIHWTTSKRLNPESIYLFDGERKITQLGLDNSATHLIPKENLLVSTRVTVGKVVINTVDITISQDLTGLLIDKKRFSLEYLAYCIYTDRVQRLLEAQKRGATIKGITRDDLKEICLPLPILVVQQEIAKILGLIDSKLEFHNSKKIELQDLFKTMLNQLMTGQSA